MGADTCVSISWLWIQNRSSFFCHSSVVEKNLVHFFSLCFVKRKRNWVQINKSFGKCMMINLDVLTSLSNVIATRLSVLRSYSLSKVGHSHNSLAFTFFKLQPCLANTYFLQIWYGHLFSLPLSPVCVSVCVCACVCFCPFLLPCVSSPSTLLVTLCSWTDWFWPNRKNYFSLSCQK